MNELPLAQLNGFLIRASKATYAGGGGEVTPSRTGFRELEYCEGDWCYRDSYTGFLRSWGQEIVWQKGKPVWTCLYGGGMTETRMDTELADKTFAFLKQALAAGNQEAIFQPRGPKRFSDGDWKYECVIKGSIDQFNGHESICYGGDAVFTHDFFGGLVIS